LSDQIRHAVDAKIRRAWLRMFGAATADQTDDFIKNIARTLLDIQASMLSAAKAKLAENTEKAITLKSFKKSFKRKDKLNAFVLAPFVEDEKVKKMIDELGVTVRCIPLVQTKESATCLFTGKETNTWALYAKSY
jgi:prolyl-tRNA synthetase